MATTSFGKKPFMRKHLRLLRLRWTVCCLIALGSGQTWAQMPVPLFDAVAPTVAEQKFEALLQCKAEAVLKTDEVEPRLKAAGLSPGVAGFFLPLKKDQRPSLFGDDVVAVLVTAADDEEKVAVYQRHQTGKKLAKRLRVSQIDDQAGTDEPSYLKK